MNKSQMFKKAHAMARAVVESAKHEKQRQIHLYGYSTINVPSYKQAFSKELRQVYSDKSFLKAIGATTLHDVMMMSYATSSTGGDYFREAA